MNSQDIISHSFDKAFNGYRTDDVDEYLKEVSEEFLQLQSDNVELVKKLEVLADKIREYRNDEDALKDALLDARRQSKQMLSDTAAKVAAMETDARKAADEIKSNAEFASAKSKESANAILSNAKDEAEKTVAGAKAEAERIINEAKQKCTKLCEDERKKADELSRKLKTNLEKEQELITRAKRESDNYRRRLIEFSKKHIETLENLPDTLETDFVRKTAETVEKREAEAAQTEAVPEAPTEAEPIKEAPIPEAETPAAAPEAESKDEKIEKALKLAENSADDEVMFAEEDADEEAKNGNLFIKRK